MIRKIYLQALSRINADIDLMCDEDLCWDWSPERFAYLIELRNFCKKKIGNKEQK